MDGQRLAGWLPFGKHAGSARAAIRATLPATALVLLALAACGRGPGAEIPASAGSGSGAQAANLASHGPKVPFGGRPCESLSLAEQGQLGIGSLDNNKPTPGQAGHDGGDDFAYDNACDYGSQTVIYKSMATCREQRDDLRSPSRAAPADLPDSFYDVLGNLWFVKNGYCVGIPNNTSQAIRGKVAHVIAAKL